MSEMRVIVTGSRGLLGTAFRMVAEQSPYVTDLLLPDRRDLDVTQELDVERYISTTRPDVVINSAVLMPADLCETHPETAYRIHALGARWVSRACARAGALPVYISTDFVFDGAARRPYRPESATNPLLTYGTTKLAGELETRAGSPRHLVLRTAGLFGPKPSSPRARPCFVHRILERADAGQPLSVVDTVVMSPTYTVDLARMTFALAFDDVEPGVYHVVNRGAASWCELARAAVELAGYEVPVHPESAQNHVAAPRPSHTPMAGDLPGRAGELQRSWPEALAEYIDQFWTPGPEPVGGLRAASALR